MALYHVHHKVFSRSSRNTVHAIAYRSGTCLVDRVTGELADYTHKSVQHVEMLLPKDAPMWVVKFQQEILKDRNGAIQALSDLAESSEKRTDSQVYREVEFALPEELTNEQNIKLANEFIQDQCCTLGMMAVQNFHFDVDEETGQDKPHCHTVLLTRRLEENGLSLKKERGGNSKEFHNTLREQWAAYQNFHLKMHGFDLRVDHRSYEEQGIDIEPQPKMGRRACEMMKKLGLETHGVEALESTLKKAESLWEQMEQKVKGLSSSWKGALRRKL